MLSANRCTPDYISGIKSLVESYTQANSSKIAPPEEVHTVDEVATMLSTVYVADENNRINHTQWQPILNGSCKKWCSVEGRK